VDSCVFQVAYVQEDIRATGVGLDKAKATIRIPPYQRADRQGPLLSLLCLQPEQSPLCLSKTNYLAFMIAVGAGASAATTTLAGE
jgi:hypothetical protein